MKSFNYIFLFFLLISCNSIHEENFEILKGEWQVTEFYHKDENLSLKGRYLIGFENNNHSWITKIEDRTNDFVSLDYRIYKEIDSLRMIIQNSEDSRFDGVYDLYVDTIQKFDYQQIIEITLDSENTYFKAIRLKNK
ncbi:hypothetical protein [Flavobacterium sp.]|uniref:hypothetical protein n=1 Tax=Flavobacterium sp. TaxID=239 RepID=UPI003D2BBE8B